jgi:hypothetical protein
MIERILVTDRWRRIRPHWRVSAHNDLLWFRRRKDAVRFEREGCVLHDTPRLAAGMLCHACWGSRMP